MSLEAVAIFYQDAVDAGLAVETAVATVEFSSTGDPGPFGKLQQITGAALNALAVAEQLPPGRVYDVTDGGFLAVPSSVSTYRQYRSIHIGPDAPDDTSVIWLQVST